MNIDIIKESTIEYIEDMYALSSNYLKNNNNLELKNLLKELTTLENNIRISEDINMVNNYKTLLEHITNRIEGIIYE